MIIVNAHRINQNGYILNTEEGDFYFIPRLDPAETVEAVIELCASHIPDRFGYDFMRDIQVLTPMRKGDTASTILMQGSSSGSTRLTKESPRSWRVV